MVQLSQTDLLGVEVEEVVVVVLQALLLVVPVLAVAAEIVVRLAPQKVDREIDPVVALCQQEALVVLVVLD